MGRIVQNQSNEGLGPIGLHLTIGNVPRVNGEDAEEIPGYVCSRHELIQLVEHWWAEVLWIGWKSRILGLEGSEEFRVYKYARRRIDQIGSLIGEEEAERGITAAESKFKNSVTEEHWRIFIEGSEEERDRTLKPASSEKPN